MNYLKKNAFNIIIIAFMLVLPVLSLAEGVGNPPIDNNKGIGNPPVDSTSTSMTITNPLKDTNTINDLIKKILEGVIKIGLPVLVLAVIYSGFLFVSAQGNSEKLSEAKRSLTYTLIGAAILLGSWAIAQLIVDTVKAL